MALTPLVQRPLGEIENQGVRMKRRNVTRAGDPGPPELIILPPFLGTNLWEKPDTQVHVQLPCSGDEGPLGLQAGSL